MRTMEELRPRKFTFKSRGLMLKHNAYKQNRTTNQNKDGLQTNIEKS